VKVFDNAGATLAGSMMYQSLVSLEEGGGSDTYTVVLDSELMHFDEHTVTSFIHSDGDATLAEAVPLGAYGAAAELKVGGVSSEMFYSIVRFPLESTNYSRVGSAVLYLFKERGGDNSGVGGSGLYVQSMSSDWDEATVAGGAYVPGASILNVSARVPLQNDTTMAIDVTTFVNDAIKLSSSSVTLGLVSAQSGAEVLGCPGCEILATSATDEVVFSSRSHSASDQWPFLQITQSTASASVSVEPNSVCAYTGVCRQQVEVTPAMLTFTHENWHVPQTVTVTAIDDQVDEGIHNATLTHSVSSNNADFNGGGFSSEGTPFTPGVNVTATITDNNMATVLLSASSVEVVEGGGNAEYDVKLSTEPIADVTIVVAGNGQVVGIPSSLVFTSSNWNTSQTVTVTAVDDALSENAYGGQHAGSVLSHSASSLDENYNTASELCHDMTMDQCNADGSICYPVTLEQCYSGSRFSPGGNVRVAVSDNDAGVTLSKTSLVVAEGSTTDSYSVVLNAAPTSTVTVSMSGSGDVSVDPSMVVFTTSNWHMERHVDVSAVDDAYAEES